MQSIPAFLTSSRETRHQSVRPPVSLTITSCVCQCSRCPSAHGLAGQLTSMLQRLFAWMELPQPRPCRQLQQYMENLRAERFVQAHYAARSACIQANSWPDSLPPGMVRQPREAGRNLPNQPAVMQRHTCGMTSDGAVASKWQRLCLQPPWHTAKRITHARAAGAKAPFAYPVRPGPPSAPIAPKM